jgi:hypothetical protein
MVLNREASVTVDGDYLLQFGLTRVRAERELAAARGEYIGDVDTTAAPALVLSVINPTATATCETKLYGALVEII